MKKLILAIVCAGFVSGMHAQSEDRKWQIGMGLQTGMNFNKPTTKSIETDGVGGHNGIGVNFFVNVSPNLGVFFAGEFDFESIKYKVTATDPVYYRYIDTEIQKKEMTEENVANNTPASLYNLTNRKYKPVYASVPVMLLFRTNTIGAFRYYGKFGPRFSFLSGGYLNDQGFHMAGDSLTGMKVAEENTEMKVKSDLSFFRASMGVVGGAQWKMNGPTTLFAEIGFYYGFTPIHYGDAKLGDDKKRDMHLFQRPAASTADEYLTFASKQKQLVLKVGILF